MSKEDKFYEKLRSKSGWRYRDLEALYLCFGFEKVEGGKHVLFIHPQHPDLRATVTRHNELATGYLQHAKKIIDQLKQKRTNYE